MRTTISSHQRTNTKDFTTRLSHIWTSARTWTNSMTSSSMLRTLSLKLTVLYSLTDVTTSDVCYHRASILGKVSRRTRALSRSVVFLSHTSHALSNTSTLITSISKDRRQTSSLSWWFMLTFSCFPALWRYAPATSSNLWTQGQFFKSCSLHMLIMPSSWRSIASTSWQWTRKRS